MKTLVLCFEESPCPATQLLDGMSGLCGPSVVFGAAAGTGIGPGDTCPGGAQPSLTPPAWKLFFFF